MKRSNKGLYANNDGLSIGEAMTNTRERSKSNKIVRTLCSIFIIILLVYLFLPFNAINFKTLKYITNSYYHVIEDIADFENVPSLYTNNFHYLIGAIDKIVKKAMGKSIPTHYVEYEIGYTSGGKYKIVDEYAGDAQLSGTSESNILKRNDNYFFHMTNGAVNIYSILGENSELVSTVDTRELGHEGYYGTSMFLLNDGNDLILVSSDDKHNTLITLIDVSNPTNLRKKMHKILPGYFRYSELTNEGLVVISSYYVPSKQIDFDDPKTYIPCITDESGNSVPISSKSIVVSKEIDALTYKVVNFLDTRTLEVQSSSALLGFDNDIYSVGDNIYLTHTYYSRKYYTLSGEVYSNTVKTEIAAISLTKDLSLKGLYSVDGAIGKDTIDELEGELRLITYDQGKFVAREGAEIPSWMKSKADKISEKKVNFYVLKNDGKNRLVTCKDCVGGFTNESNIFITAFEDDKVYLSSDTQEYVLDISKTKKVKCSEASSDIPFTPYVQLSDDLFLEILNSEDKLQLIKYDNRTRTCVSTFSYTGAVQTYSDYKSFALNKERKVFALHISGYRSKNSGKSISTYFVFSYADNKINKIAEVSEDHSTSFRIRAFIQEDYVYVIDDDWYEVIKINH